MARRRLGNLASKGLALWHQASTASLSADGDYVTFGVPDYPLWWSALGALDVQAVGSLDVRVMTAQFGILAAAFLMTVARLLWERVRPSFAVAGVALIALSPEFWRHAHGGIAGLPLAIYVALFALTLAAWVSGGEGWLLGVAVVAGVTAARVKTEGVVEVMIIGGRRSHLCLRKSPCGRCGGHVGGGG